MKYSIIICLMLTTIFSCQTEKIESWTLIPYPNSISANSGHFTFEHGITFLASDSSLNPSISFFKDKLNDIEIDTDSKSNRTIELALISSDEMKAEAYELVVNKKQIKLSASDPKGIFYGLMTIWQELKFSQSMTVPCGVIKDEPRFEYRGFMLDVSRHFFEIEKVKQIIDVMAVFKLNTFHWHLTDSQGWRIEIKSYPKLAEIGGIGNKTNSDAEAKYYTQDEIREVVIYAKERFIEIIPEIDMPGHTAAANRAYPEYSGGGEKNPGSTFDVGKEKTYIYLSAILDEVAELFPSNYIHLGGDEVGHGNWKTNDSIQSLMKRNGLTSHTELEHYFMERMEKELSIKNKKLAGWDEIVGSDLNNETALVYWWRHNKPEQLEKSLAKGFNTVLCPRVPLYLDFVQHDRDKIGRRWNRKGFGTTEDIYNYPDSTHEFSEKETTLIKGIQANLWTEKVVSKKRLDYLIFPRIVALSESAWTKQKSKDFLRFGKNLPSVFEMFDEQNIYYFNSLNPLMHKEPEY